MRGFDPETRIVLFRLGQFQKSLDPSRFGLYQERIFCNLKTVKPQAPDEGIGLRYIAGESARPR